MPAPNKPAGQRATLTSASGRKRRSETSTPHSGSRVEPSHELERGRETRVKKAVKKTTTAGKRGKPKAPASTKSRAPRPGTAAMKPSRKRTG